MPPEIAGLILFYQCTLLVTFHQSNNVSRIVLRIQVDNTSSLGSVKEAQQNPNIHLYLLKMDKYPVPSCHAGHVQTHEIMS